MQSTDRRTRILDTDVRVGDYQLDSTHAIRSSDFDFSSAISGHAVPLPLADDPVALRTVAWRETDRRYKEAAERLVKIRTQRTLKVAEEDPVRRLLARKARQLLRAAGHAEGRRADLGAAAAPAVGALPRPGRDLRLAGDVAGEQRTRAGCSTRKGRWSRPGATTSRVLQADTRADDGMELERFESFDAASFDSLAGDAR